MRKLLVASQKGGVGKTTTSINLAAATATAGARVLLLDADPLSSISSSLDLIRHPDRQPLRQVGVDLPGVLTCNVLPGLDVLSPYDESGCSDADFNRLLQVLAAPTFRESYACLIVDTPPFLGANPGPLLALCDEYVLVMRAEAMAHRTLPAFLELVQRSRGPELKLRGILMTLGEGDTSDSRWERELRGRLGSRILPQTIPHDEEVSRLLLAGRIIAHAAPSSPASVQYHALVASLSLAQYASEAPATLDTAAALLLTTASLKNACAGLTVPLPPVAPSRGDPRETNPVRPNAPSVPLELPPDLTHWQPGTPATAPRPSRRVATVQPVAKPAPAVRPTPPRPAPPAPAGFPLHFGLLWVGLAIVVGVGLRFLKLPETMLPILVGVGVAAVVVMAYRFLPGNDPVPPPRKRKPRSASALPHG